MIYLILFLILEPIKRILSPILYPLAFVLRVRLRKEKVMWDRYLYVPTFKPLWFFLNDGEKLCYGVEYANQEKYYPGWVWRIRNPFFLSFWFNAIRNSCVNWNNWMALKLGKFVSEVKHYGGTRDFVKIRRYEHGERMYMEFWILGRRNQCGWLDGMSPRFEIDIMKERKV